MKFTMRPKNKQTEVYIVQIGYEHGDGDVYTHEEVRLEGYSKQEAQEYFSEVEKVYKEICDFLDGKIDVRDERIVTQEYDFELSTKRKAYIPIHRDCFSDVQDDIMAPMSIEEIVYFDEDGDAFDVTEWDV